MNLSDLENLGFEGFIPLRSLPAGCKSVTAEGGVYVVASPDRSGEFAQKSVGGHFKSKDPSVPVERLRAKWVSDVDTLYIGRAKSLRRRLDQFARFGRGEPIGHWGGRYLWQVADPSSLLVAWLEAVDPVEAEAELVAEFVDRHGSLPFANLNQPRGVPK